MAKVNDESAMYCKLVLMHISLVKRMAKLVKTFLKIIQIAYSAQKPSIQVVQLKQTNKAY